MISEILYIFFLILFVVFSGCLILVGGFFIARGRKISKNNLYIAGIGFLILPIGFIGNLVFNLGFLFQEIFVFFCFILTVIFTNLTFHRNRKLAPNLVLILVLVLGLIQLIFHAITSFSSLNPYYEKVSLDVPYTLLVFNWLSWSSYSAYKLLKNQDIEPWIKLRYKIVAIFSFIISFHSIPEFFQPTGFGWGDPGNNISLMVFGATAILVVIFSIGFTFAWIMPNWMKKHANKDYKPLEEKELSEDELMNLIKKQLKEHDE